MGGEGWRHLSQVLEAPQQGPALVGAQARDVVGAFAEDVEQVEHGQHHLHVRGGQQRRQVLRGTPRGGHGSRTCPGGAPQGSAPSAEPSPGSPAPLQVLQILPYFLHNLLQILQILLTGLQPLSRFSRTSRGFSTGTFPTFSRTFSLFSSSFRFSRTFSLFSNPLWLL